MSEIFNIILVLPLKNFFYLSDYLNIQIGTSIIILSLLVKVILINPENWINKIISTKSFHFQNIKNEVRLATKNLKGEEKFDLTNEIYKKNYYNPFYEIILILPYLIQIPFFLIIYYCFKSINSEIFYNKDYYFISDLSNPDNLIYLFSFNLNLLPILMTVINLIALTQFDKKYRNGNLDYLLPLFFFILLYNQPSALVLYWTNNNLIYLLIILFKKFYKRSI